MTIVTQHLLLLSAYATWSDRAYLPSHFNRCASFRGYLSPMSLAVSVPRMRSRHIAMMPRRGLLTFWNHD
ncbi:MULTISPECIES: hypothetical protein [unclassified Coleofasciculus]|uniref:hypothetical protein n=1 Tax=unclassified Coleofasciculus TaxID=2692782 RepID=UPI0018814A95|nr:MULTISPECIES: hypothetical protein [unclassified Coleofasciculus]MBE9128637.1 hypothetical protein [Coleofasciculus sp. LEGE 07081]MBE9147257.1 hypothetical protein [Coleofasciculus sp. LEGE 07092]